jgi:hypothetical protein
MPVTQTGSAAVLLAQQFNPTILKQSWLERYGILATGDLESGSLFSDVLVQVRSRQFHMLLLPDQLHFMPVVPAAEQQRLIVDKLGGIVVRLPETPYRALGLNFVWQLTTADGNKKRSARDLFFIQGSPLYDRFNAEDARFGAYLSKDFAGFRLKLDIKPIVIPGGDQTESGLQFAFNFHVDITSENSAPQIIERLGQWEEVLREAEGILSTVEPRQV